MSGYVNFPSVTSEPVFCIFSDWAAYQKDDGTFGWLLSNGVPTPVSFSALSDKPLTYPPTIGTTSVTAKAGNYTPSWSEISSAIPPSATFMPVVGTSASTAKAGNWFPSWLEVSGKPDSFAPSAHSHAIADVVGLQTALNGKMAVPTGTTSQYVRGDGSLATFVSPASPSVGYPTRTTNTPFQVSATRSAIVSYSVQINVTASISGGQNGDVFLEVASDAAFTSNVQIVSCSGLGQTYTLAVAIQGIQPQTGCVSGVVPAGYYARLRTVNNTGTPTYSVRYSQETLL